MKNITVSIVIPCLNEVSTIERAVIQAKETEKIKGVSLIEIIVADNGSTDGSIEKVVKQGIAQLVKVPVRGYGAALHWGIMKARGEYVFFADADLSYDFIEIKKFSPLMQKNYDLILGSRLIGKISDGAMPFLNRYLGTPVLTFLIRVLYGIKTTDCNSGMRVVKRDFYKKLNMRNSGMEWASELLLKTAIKKGKYAEAPISFYKDKRGRHPHLSRWSDGWRHLKAILLLKPIFLVFTTALFLVLALLSLPYSFGFTSFFMLFSFVTLLSFFVLKYFSFVIEGKHNFFSKLLNSIPLMPLTVVLILLTVIIIIFLPDKHLGTKILLASLDAITFMWVFLIETIRTHLINRLPDIK